MANELAPHKVIVAVRLKTYEVDKHGQTIPPIVEKDKEFIVEFTYENKSVALLNREELLKKVKECLQ